MNTEPLFPGRDPRAGTDAALDALLHEAFLSKRTQKEATDATPMTPSVSSPVVTPPVGNYLVSNNIEHGAGRLSLLSQPNSGWFARLAWILGLSLAILAAGRALENWRVASTHVPAVVQTRSTPSEPSIGVSGPELRDTFTDWAPRAVLVQLPAPRAQLVRLPVPRAQLVRLP